MKKTYDLWDYLIPALFLLILIWAIIMIILTAFSIDDRVAMCNKIGYDTFECGYASTNCKCYNNNGDFVNVVFVNETAVILKKGDIK